MSAHPDVAPRMPHKHPANSPPYRLTKPGAAVCRAIEATLAAREA